MIPTMEKSFREKIALAVFLALIVLSSIGLGWYILAGHSWNVAASTIDDTVGEMEGYTAIVYPGTLEVPEEPSEARKGADRLGVSQDDGDEVVDLGVLQEDYADKGAEVLFIDVLNPSKYQEGVIVKRGGKRIGVVSAAGSATQLDVARCLQAFEQASVDFTVVITPDKWKVSRLVGIDIVICTDDEGLVAMGETDEGTFYVDAPALGEAGVVLVSPSNVVSAKEVSAS